MLKRSLQTIAITSALLCSVNAEIISTTKQVSTKSLSTMTDFMIGDTKFFFMGTDYDEFGKEPWVSDGTPAGTHMIHDFTEGTSHSSYTFLATLGDKLIFSDTSKNLLITDGTYTNTKYIKDSQDRKVTLYSSDSNYFTKYKNEFYFTRSNVDAIGAELWKTDGNTVTLVKNIHSDSTYGTNSSPQLLNVINGNLVFVADNANNGREMWTSNGTSDGTKLIKDIYPGTGNTNFTILGSTGTELYFHTSHYSSLDRHYIRSIWKTNGTIAGTVQLVTSKSTDKDINIQYGNERFAYTKDGKVFFMASTKEYDSVAEKWNAKGYELWVSNGTPAGTKMVKDFNVGSNSSSFYYFRAINNKIIFRNDNDADRIWVSDGTAEGTKELTDKDGNSLYPYYHYYWDQDKHISQELNGKLYFASRKNENDVHGLELWTTDGTNTNTYMVKDINPGNRESRPERFFTFNNKVYFSAETAERGRELWVTDGTKIGTQMIHDVYYGYNPSNMNIIGALNNKLYFTAESSYNDNYRIWETTGDVTVDADRLLDVNVTKAINATMEKCKTDPAACGINTVAPKLDAEVLSKKGLGWHMVGTAEAIDDMSIFNGTDTVWKWTGSNWQVYSPDPALQSAINDSNLGNLNRLEAFDGVWIRKK